MGDIVLTEEQRKDIIDETNNWIEENNKLAMDMLGLEDQITRIGFIQRITAKPGDRYLYSKLRDTYYGICTRYLQNKHRIEVNEEILGIRKKKKINKIL